MLPMIERLAALPDFDVAKLEKLLDMQERVLNRQAKEAFSEAFAKMQPEIPEIDEKGRILNKGQTSVRSTYAKLEDIMRVLKPILQTHGFALRHRTEFPADRPGILRIVGILSHIQGHSEESAFEAPKDDSDYRTDIQSMGSTVSYGRRYTTCDLLNITTRAQDDDGATGGRMASPTGFDAWFAALEGLVEEGPNTLQQTFSKATPEFKNFTVQHRKTEWDEMKRRAQKAQSAGRRA